MILAALGVTILFAVVIVMAGSRDCRETILKHDGHNGDFRKIVSALVLEFSLV